MLVSRQDLTSRWEEWVFSPEVLSYSEFRRKAHSTAGNSSEQASGFPRRHTRKAGSVERVIDAAGLLKAYNTLRLCTTVRRRLTSRVAVKR